MMQLIETLRGKCAFCPKGKEQLLFVVKGDTFSGKACPEHIAALMEEAKEKPKEEQQ